MRKSFLLLICLFFCISSKAQFRSYHAGSYYTTSGQKISGLIDFRASRDRIFFKADKGASSEKILIAEIKAVVLTEPDIDSVTVVTENNKENKRYFAKFITETKAMRFYYKFRQFNTGGVPEMTTRPSPNPNAGGSQPSFINQIHWSNSPNYSGVMTIVMYQDGETTYELTKKNYVEILSKAFADIPDLMREIQSKEFKFKNVNNMLTGYTMPDHK